MKLIINSDDFGLSQSISDGIICGIQGGYITSTSIMANMPAAEYAIKKSVELGIDCIGLHVNLTVGKPIIQNSNLVDNNGVFLYNREQIENSKLTYEDAYNEIIAQIEKVNDLSCGNLKIDHLDMHHRLCDNKNIKRAFIDIANKLNIPVRNIGDINVKCPDIFYTEFTIENVNINQIKDMVEKYKSEDITVELVTHSGFIDEYTKNVTSYLDREKELKVLKESKECGLFDGIQLINFKEF